MNIIDLIRKKQNRQSLDAVEIQWFVDSVCNQSIADYQISAMLMAMYLCGLTKQETLYLTQSMAASGDFLDTSSIQGITVDKHSTGGVADTTTLLVVPIAAALGCKIMKMSGRGLGHTGGTIDKLESIPHFRTEIAPELLIKQVNEIGLCVAGQSEKIVPADKKLYAIRNVTATIDSLPLIASSIMSKKLASGAQCIVLDVKYGDGAFMKTQDEAQQLAAAMIEIGTACGRKMSAFLSNMNVPLGKSVGNVLEVTEALHILRGAEGGALQELSLQLSAELARLAHSDPPSALETWYQKAQEVLKNGQAYELFKKMVAYQGGALDCIEHPESFGTAPYIQSIYAPCDGYIVSCKTEEIGNIVLLLGAGRQTKEDIIDPLAGILLHKTVGDRVQAGEEIAQLHTSHEHLLPHAAERYLQALSFSQTPPEKEPLVAQILQSSPSK